MSAIDAVHLLVLDCECEKVQSRAMSAQRKRLSQTISFTRLSFCDVTLMTSGIFYFTANVWQCPRIKTQFHYNANNGLYNTHSHTL